MLAIEQYKNAVDQLCAKHKVRQLYVFGSALTDRYNTASDIDLIVSFELMPAGYAGNYFDLQFSLQDIFHRKIDLLEEQAIKNPFFRENVNQHKTLIYGH